MQNKYLNLYTCYKRKVKILKVALLINEYFGACGTGFGGYVFLARRYIARYILKLPTLKIA